jgi:hypothetical protein
MRGSYVLSPSCKCHIVAGKTKRYICKVTKNHLILYLSGDFLFISARAGVSAAVGGRRHFRGLLLL